MMTMTRHNEDNGCSGGATAADASTDDKPPIPVLLGAMEEGGRLTAGIRVDDVD